VSNPLSQLLVPKLGGLSLSRSRPLKRSLKESTGGAGGSDDEDEEYEDEYYDEVWHRTSLIFTVSSKFHQDEGGSAEQSRLVKHSKIAQQFFGEDTVLVIHCSSLVFLCGPSTHAIIGLSVYRLCASPVGY